MKSAQIRSFFCSIFSCFQSEYREIRNTDQKKLRIWTLHAVCFVKNVFINILQKFAGKYLWWCYFFCEIFKSKFCRTSVNDCFCKYLLKLATLSSDQRNCAINVVIMSFCLGLNKFLSPSAFDEDSK